MKRKCPKCGSTDINVKYRSYDDRLEAGCRTCGYQFILKPLDYKPSRRGKDSKLSIRPFKSGRWRDIRGKA